MSPCWGVGGNRRGEEATRWGCLAGSIRPCPALGTLHTHQEMLLSYGQSSPYESVWFTGIALRALRAEDKAELLPPPASPSPRLTF